MKRFIVWALEALCTLTDRLYIDRLTHTHHLALWSDTLDQRWGTGLWKDAPTDD